MKGEKNVAGKQRPQLATRPADTGGAPAVEPTYVERSGRRSLVPGRCTSASAEDFRAVWSRELAPTGDRWGGAEVTYY